MAMRWKPLLTAVPLAVMMTASANAKVMTLTMWDWFLPRIDIYKQVIADYEKENPNIKIKLSQVAYPMSDKLLATVIAGTPPDMLNFHNSWASRTFKILSPYPPDIFPMSKMKQDYWGFTPAFDFGGKMYFAPEGLMTSAIFYNKQYWAEAGLSSLPKTWGDLRLAAKKLTKKNGDGRLTMPGLNVSTDLQYMWDDLNYQQGGWLYNKDKTGVEWNTPAGLKALSFLSQLIHEDRVSPTAGDLGGAFETGKAGMVYSWTWRRTDLLKYPKLQYGVFVIPSESGGDLPARARNNWECGLAVPANVKADRKAEAFRFIRWFMNREKYHIKLNDAIGTVPGQLALWDHDELMKDEVISTVMKQVPYTVFPGERPDWVMNVLAKMQDSIVNKKASPEQALAKAQAEGQVEFRKVPPKWIVERQYKPGK